MGNIEVFYILNHSHTDIGFTNNQDLVFRQHARLHGPGDRALWRKKRPTTRPKHNTNRLARSRGQQNATWGAAGPARLDKSMKWHKRGRLDVCAMQYNFTPLLGVEQMYRSLLPIRRLRERWASTSTRRCSPISTGLPGFLPTSASIWG